MPTAENKSVTFRVSGRRTQLPRCLIHLGTPAESCVLYGLVAAYHRHDLTSVSQYFVDLNRMSRLRCQWAV